MSDMMKQSLKRCVNRVIVSMFFIFASADRNQNLQIWHWKPFLPTDFLALLEKIKNVLVSQKPEESKEAEEEIDLSEDEPEEAIEKI